MSLERFYRSEQYVHHNYYQGTYMSNLHYLLLLITLPEPVILLSISG